MFKAKMLQDGETVDNELKVSDLCVKWTINNFSKRPECIDSPIFSVHSTKDLKWNLRVHRIRRISKGRDFLGMYILVMSNGTKVNVNARFSVVHPKPKICNMVADYGVGLRDFVKHNFLLDKTHNIIPEDKVTIICEIFIDDCHCHPKIEISEINSEKSTDLSIFLRSLLENQKFCDVTLFVSGQEFRAHKVILSARCPYFRKIFEANMNTDKVLINTHIDVFMEILYFIYTDGVLNLDECAGELYIAARKYGLHTLKLMCEDALCDTFSLEDATTLFILATRPAPAPAPALESKDIKSDSK